MYSGGVLSKTNMHQSKTQFYSGDGTGRDTYVYNNNGGFCPAAFPTKIEEQGMFHFNIIVNIFLLILYNNLTHTPFLLITLSFYRHILPHEAARQVYTAHYPLQRCPVCEQRWGP